MAYTASCSSKVFQQVGRLYASMTPALAKKYQANLDVLTPIQQMALGQVYISGKLGQKNIRKGESLLYSAADAGLPSARYVYERLQSPNHHLNRYQLAEFAQEGLLDAQVQLGYRFYHRGSEKPHFYHEAFPYIYAAAVHGCNEAMETLGHMYANGEGTKQNVYRAIVWYTLSNTDTLKTDQINKLIKNFTPNDYLRIDIAAHKVKKELKFKFHPIHENTANTITNPIVIAPHINPIGKRVN